ncbi:hemerythrin domain-containing protein [Streptomyces sp. NPDC012403]|uniref:hemerythrin domain-containing protein n=1 Tax=Streptomyces sp. NPDC012403 TaxID=3364831 RepID=UPI0036E2D6BC
MCEYCGCQSLTAIDDLTREHDAVVDLIGHVRDAHRAGDTDRTAALEAEHRRIEAVREEAAAGTPRDVTWPDRLMGALDLLRGHILKEQDGVFPAAPAVLSTEQWEAVEAVRARVGSRVEQPAG